MPLLCACKIEAKILRSEKKSVGVPPPSAFLGLALLYRLAVWDLRDFIGWQRTAVACLTLNPHASNVGSPACMYISTENFKMLNVNKQVHILAECCKSSFLIWKKKCNLWHICFPREKNRKQKKRLNKYMSSHTIRQIYIIMNFIFQTQTRAVSIHLKHLIKELLMCSPGMDSVIFQRYS